MLIANGNRSTMQIACARVVTKPCPEMQHFIDRRIGKRAHIRKALHKTLVVGDHGRHLRLLQHDLADPDAVGGAVALPRQIVTTGPRVPGDQFGSELGGDGIEIHLAIVMSNLRSAASVVSAPTAQAH